MAHVFSNTMSENKIAKYTPLNKWKDYFHYEEYHINKKIPYRIYNSSSHNQTHMEHPKETYNDPIVQETKQYAAHFHFDKM